MNKLEKNEKRKSKMFVLSTISMLICFLCLTIVFVVVIDPFYVYHKPNEKMIRAPYSEYYQNPGIARNFNYETVVVGSSMTQPLSVSEVNSIYETTAVKLSFSNMKPKNFRNISNVIFSKKSPKRFIFSLDMYYLASEPTSEMLPEASYLYDQNYLNDVNYVFNKEVIFTQCINALTNSATYDDFLYPYEESYGKYEYAKEIALTRHTEANLQVAITGIDNNILYENVNENLDYIVELAKLNPETEFIAFIPPYSILYWDRLAEYSKVDVGLEMIEISFDKISEIENIQLYCFLNDTEIVVNLDNYIDSTHFSSEVMSYMVKTMNTDDYLVTNENKDLILDEIKTITELYPYTQYK